MMSCRRSSPIKIVEMSRRPHWTEYLAELRSYLAHHPQMLIASDFDGTLSPLVDHPADAALHPTALSVLESLAALHPRVRLAFLSGRSLADLAARLPLIQDSIVLGGNHGLELRGAGLDWRHPMSTQVRPHLEMLATRLQQVLRVTGAQMEDKGASLTVHYRRVATVDLPGLHAAITRIELPEGIRRHDGKDVVEYRPHVEWHKGHALRRIQQHFDIPPAATIFLGDDATDEDAFRELDSRGITLHVGPESAVSLAELRAHHPRDAIQFLQLIATTLSTS